MIDGIPVKLNDRVFITGLGYGIVSKLAPDGGFFVRLGNRGDLSLTTGGMINNTRRAYWADPFIISPPRNRKLWNSFMSIAKYTYSVLEQIYNAQEAIDEEDTE